MHPVSAAVHGSYMSFTQLAPQHGEVTEQA
jgi:hypothetical protein